MKRWLFLLLFFPVIAFGQFRMVSSTVTLDSTVNDSTYIIDVDFFSDQTAKGYFASGITADYRVFSQTGQLYDITAASNLTLSSGELTIVEIDNNYVNTESAPVGQILVFDPQGDYITFTPFGNSNMGQVLQQAIGTYNAVVSAEGGSVPEWSETANYEQFKQVSQNGKIYTNRTGTNTTTPPSSDLVNWELTNKSAILEDIDGRDTISQASHPFSVGDPLWYSGDYILAQDTGASVRVDGVVIEVIDANTFVRQRSGKFTLSSHGFTVNIQLYVQPDGSYSAADTSNALVYGYPIDANTIEIGLKPDRIKSISEKYDSIQTGIRAANKQSALDTLAIIQPSTNILSIKNSVAKLGTQLFNKETRGIYKVEGTKKTKSQAAVDTLDADGITQFLLPSGFYAQAQPINGKLYFTHFRDTNYTETEILQALVTYSWAYMSVSDVVIDTVITITNTVIIPYGVSIEGISRNAKSVFDPSSANQRSKGVVFVDINDVTKAAFRYADNSPGGQQEGVMFKHLAIEVLSPLESVIRAREQRGNFMHDVNIEGNRYVKYGLVIKGGIDTQVTFCEIGGCTESAVFLEGHTYNNTSTIFSDCSFTSSKYGITYDTTGSVGAVKMQRSFFELIDSSAVKISADQSFECSFCESESIGSGIGGAPVFEGGSFNLYFTKVVGESFGNNTDVGVKILGEGSLTMIGGEFTLITDPVTTDSANASVNMYFVRHRSTTNNVYDNSYTGIANRDNLNYLAAGTSNINFPGYNKLHSLKLRDSLTLEFATAGVLQVGANGGVSTLTANSGELIYGDASGVTSTSRMSYGTTIGLNVNSVSTDATTSAFRLQNGTPTAMFRVMGNGEIRIGSNFYIRPIDGTGTTSLSGKSLMFESQQGSAASSGLGVYFKRDFNAAFNTTDRGITIGGTFNPTSSTADKHAIEIRDVVNQTGTASGDWKGLYINPTLTAVLGTANAIETTGGNTSLADQITFSDYGNSSTYDLSTLGKSKGTNPYPVFASDGTIANESTIPASDISSSGDSTNVQSEITGFDARLDSLEQLFTTGAATPTTDLSGQFTITHGLGTTPTHLSVGNLSGTEYNFEYSCGSTSCTVTVYDGTGTDTTVNSTGISISWAAFK